MPAHSEAVLYFRGGVTVIDPQHQKMSESVEVVSPPSLMGTSVDAIATSHQVRQASLAVSLLQFNALVPQESS